VRGFTEETHSNYIREVRAFAAFIRRPPARVGSFPAPEQSNRASNSEVGGGEGFPV